MGIKIGFFFPICIQLNAMDLEVHIGLSITCHLCADKDEFSLNVKLVHAIANSIELHGKQFLPPPRHSIMLTMNSHYFAQPSNIPPVTVAYSLKRSLTFHDLL